MTRKMIPLPPQKKKLFMEQKKYKFIKLMTHNIKRNLTFRQQLTTLSKTRFLKFDSFEKFPEKLHKSFTKYFIFYQKYKN